MAIPDNNAVFIHKGYNCSSNVIPTAQSIPISSSDNTSVKDALSALSDNIAPDYDSTQTYSVGDYVIYDNLLYRCNTAISVAEEWTPAHWTQITVAEELAEKADTSSLATVATTGSYNDLSNKPTIPAAQVNSDWNANSGVAQILNKPTIPTVNYDTEPTAGHEEGFTVTSEGIKQAIDSVIEDLDALVAEAVEADLGDNYYNKTQTDEKIAALIDDTEAQANKTYSSNKIGNLLSDKASIQENQGINLYNKNASGIQSGYYINSVGGFNTAAYCEVSDFTEVKPSTSYSHRYEDYMGVKSKYFNLYDENKQFLSMAIGSENSGVITVTTTATTKYIKYNVRISNRDTFMLSEGSTIPPYYIAYVSPFFSLNSAISIPNKIFKKIAIFDGDSIGAGNSVGQSDPSYGLGWAGRIGIPNHMNWHNYCVAGGTITYVDNNRHCISRDIDKIHSEYPTLDYLILEGGTNDADFQTMGGSSIDMTDYSGNYDDTKFCGAVETLFYKALNYFPYAKIGFIIAPKMGYTTSVGFYEGNRRREYFEVIMQACKKWSIPYLDLWNDGQLNPMIPSMYEYGATVEENIARGSVYTDGQHLTAKGYDVITPKIEAFMRSL